MAKKQRRQNITASIRPAILLRAKKRAELDGLPLSRLIDRALDSYCRTGKRNRGLDALIAPVVDSGEGQKLISSFRENSGALEFLSRLRANASHDSGLCRLPGCEKCRKERENK